jgi:uncharacterized protein (TIGR03067 family)
LQWIEFAADHVVVFDGRSAKLAAEFFADVEAGTKTLRLNQQFSEQPGTESVWRQGIYRLERDRLILCWAGPQQPVPTEFAGDQKQGTQLLVLRREWNPPADFDPSKTPPPRAVIPFTADEAKRYQEAWARSANVPVEMTNSLGMKLRLIPAGAFDSMGASMHKQRSEGVATAFSRPVYVGVNEVTIAQFRKFVEATGYKTAAELQPQAERLTWRNPGIEQDSDQHPVVRVSWQDANEFCRWLSETEHEQYRLPRSTEWVFAAQAGAPSNSRIKPPVNARLKFFDTTAPIGGDTASVFGMHDLFGNAGEWCDYITGGATETNMRICMGGSFRNAVNDWGLPAAAWFMPRVEAEESSHFDDIGFRVVRVIAEPTKAQSATEGSDPK